MEEGEVRETEAAGPSSARPEGAPNCRKEHGDSQAGTEAAKHQERKTAVPQTHDAKRLNGRLPIAQAPAPAQERSPAAREAQPREERQHPAARANRSGQNRDDKAEQQDNSEPEPEPEQPEERCRSKWERPS